jgi:hypothetical protein
MDTTAVFDTTGEYRTLIANAHHSRDHRSIREQQRDWTRLGDSTA